MKFDWEKVFIGYIWMGYLGGVAWVYTAWSFHGFWKGVVIGFIMFTAFLISMAITDIKSKYTWKQILNKIMSKKRLRSNH